MTSHGSGANGIEGTVNGAQDTVSVNAFNNLTGGAQDTVSVNTFRAQSVGLSGQNAGGTDEGNERARSGVTEGNAQSGVAQRGVSVDMAHEWCEWRYGCDGQSRRIHDVTSIVWTYGAAHTSEKGN